jgi:hypothetical protein
MHTHRQESEFGGLISIDTTFVLFFLALEYGRSVRFFSVDGALMGTTMLMVLALPYFLPSRYAKPTFSNWIAGRTAIACLGLLLGIAMSYSVGTILPVGTGVIPMAGLIVAAFISCYIQFYSLMKLRPVK